MQWRTKLTIVEETTGEILNKKQVEKKDYKIIKKQIKYNKINDYLTEKNITWVCEKSRQYELF